MPFVTRLQPIRNEWVKLTPAWRRRLLLLLAADLLLLLLHTAHFLHLLPDPRFSVETDGGFAEIFQYGKELFVMLAFAGLALARREPHFAVWSALFAFVLADDWLMLHEEAGAVLASRYELFVPGLRGRDVGELLFAALMGAALLPLLALTYWRADLAVRRDGRIAAVLVALLAGCGIGLDLLHQALYRTPFFVPAGMAEDGGEMLAMTLLVVWAGSRYAGRAAPAAVSSTAGRSSGLYPNRESAQSNPAPAGVVSPPRR
ncbi:MAG: hypothetical protein JNK87_12225 [Bryobacterales bacterium]|nr:hypothetical protein [Bryobacterales bacterium]